VFGDGRKIVGPIAPRENAAEDSRVKRLDASIEHFRKAGVFSDIANRQALVGEKLASAARAEQLHAGGGQPSSEVGQAKLIADTDDSAAKGNRFHDSSQPVVETVGLRRARAFVAALRSGTTPGANPPGDNIPARLNLKRRSNLNRRGSAAMQEESAVECAAPG
jgi:hypothetical protein